MRKTMLPIILVFSELPYQNKFYTEKFSDWIVDFYHRTRKIIDRLKRWDDPKQTLVFRNISRTMFIASLIVGVFWFLGLFASLATDKQHNTLNKFGIFLQIIGTLSVVPELLHTQDSEKLQNIIQTASKQLDGKIKIKDIYNGKTFLLLEQDGVFGFINLFCHTWFALRFIVDFGPSTVGQSDLAPFSLFGVLIFYLIIFCWVFFSMVYWGSKVYNIEIPEWIIAVNFFLNLLLAPGVIIAFSIVASSTWVIIKLLNWLSQFPIKKVFIIITLPFVLSGMLLQLLAA